MTFTAPIGITAAPTGTASVREETALTIDLSDVPGATEWAHRPVVNGTPGAAVTHSSQRIRLTGLTAGTDYVYQFRAGNSLGDGPWSASQTFSTIEVDEDEDVPTGLAVAATVQNVRTAGGDAQTFEWQVTQFRVSATVPADAVGWDLRYSTELEENPEADRRRTISRTGTGSVNYNVPHHSLNTNRIYFVSVRARKADGTVSGWSDPLAVFPYVIPFEERLTTGQVLQLRFDNLRSGSIIEDGVDDFSNEVETRFRGFNDTVADAGAAIDDFLEDFASVTSVDDVSFGTIQSAAAGALGIDVTPGQLADMIDAAISTAGSVAGTGQSGQRAGRRIAAFRWRFARLWTWLWRQRRQRRRGTWRMML